MTHSGRKRRPGWLLILAVLTGAMTRAQEPPAAAPAVAAGKEGTGASGEIPDPSGAYYDWTKTLQPERPYIHDYSQTLAMKIFLAEKQPNEGCRVYLTFEQALEVMRKLDNLTLGIPKIVYLVGWQHNGHDSMYPDWSVVNPRLKRPQDQTAVDSLKWLMAEGFKYHTTVSLHINMLDAYSDSPLWQTYVEHDIIAKDKDGNLMRGHQLSYWQEWKTGYARKRIDGLLAMLPIQKAGTIHIDAFHSVAPSHRDEPISPFLGNTTQDEVATQRKILRYYRTKGVDVTSEGTTFLRPDAFVGLQPMAWWYDAAPAPHIPASLDCGTPMHAEEEIKKDPQNLTGLKAQFCRNVVPWFYANNTTAAKGRQTNVVPWHYESHTATETRNDDDICMPALWRKQVLVAYSKNGYQNKTWPLPPGWEGVTKVRVAEVTLAGLTNAKEISTENGSITLSVDPGQELEIVNP